MTKKSLQKLKYLLRKKRAFKMKKLLIIFKGLSMKQITRIFLEGEVPTLRAFMDL